MKECPNKNTLAWKELSKVLHPDYVFLAWLRNNKEVPTAEKAKELLGPAYPVKDLEKLLELSGAIHKYNKLLKYNSQFFSKAVNMVSGINEASNKAIGENILEPKTAKTRGKTGRDIKYVNIINSTVPLLKLKTELKKTGVWRIIEHELLNSGITADDVNIFATAELKNNEGLLGEQGTLPFNFDDLDKSYSIEEPVNKVIFPKAYSIERPESLEGVDGIIRKLEERMNLLHKKQSKYNALKDKQSAAIAAAEYDKVAEMAEVLREEDSLSKVLEVGELEMKEVENILNQDNLTTGDLSYVYEVIDMWRTFEDMLFSQEERTEKNPSANLTAARNIIAEADRLELIWKDLMTTAVKNLGREQEIPEEFVQDLENTKDISFWQRKFLGASSMSSIPLSMKARVRREASAKAEFEFFGIEKMVDKLAKAMKDSPLYKAGGKAVFGQRNKDGELTGRMVDFLKDEYIEIYYDLVNKAKKKNEGAQRRLNRFIKENDVIFDPRQLFNKVDGELVWKDNQVYIYKLKQQLLAEGYTEEEFNRYLNKQIKIGEQYNADRVTEELRIRERNSRNPEVELAFWEKRNNPFDYAAGIDTGSSVFTWGNRKYVNTGYRYVVRLAKQQWHDPQYRVIMNDPALKEFYEYWMKTMEELYSFIPESKRFKIAANILPEVRKDLMAKFLEGDFVEAFSDAGDQFKGVFTTTENDVADKENLSIPFLPKGTKAERMEAAKTQSYDMPELLKFIAKSVLIYKNKIIVEDKMKLMSLFIDELGLEETKKASDFYTDAFYGKAREQKPPAQIPWLVRKLVPGISEDGKRILKTKHLEQKKTLKAELEKVSEEDKPLIQAQIDALGEQFSWHSSGDALIKATYLIQLTYSFGSGISNAIRANIENILWAAGDEDFNLKEWRDGFLTMFNTTANLVTFGAIDTDTSKKIRNLMTKFGYPNQISSDFGGKTKNTLLHPMGAMEAGEYFAQGNILISRLKRIKVTDTKGVERPLFEAYDTEGNWKIEEFGEENFEKLFKDVTLVVDQAIYKSQGNYDPVNSAIEAKKDILGRMLMVFRSFMPEAIAARGMQQHYSVFRGRQVKGRWRTAIDLGPMNSFKVMAKIAQSMATDVEYTELIDPKTGKVDPVALANMKRNFTEVSLYMTLMLTGLFLKYLQGGDDEDDEGINPFNLMFFMNQTERMQIDMAQYWSPRAFMTISGQTLVPPAATLFKALDLTEAMARTLAGDATIKSGPNKDLNRIGVAAIGMTPYLNGLFKTRKSSKASQDRDYDTEDFVEDLFDNE